MSSSGAPGVNQTSYKTLFFQGLATIATAKFAGELRTFEHYKTESLATAGLGIAATALAQIASQTTNKNDFKSFMLKAFVLGATIIGASCALQKWPSVRALPLDRAVTLAGLEIGAMALVTILAKRFEHKPPAPPVTPNSLKIPASAQEVVDITPLHLNLYYERFSKDKNEWTTLLPDVRNTFFQLFFHHHYSAIDPSDGNLNAGWLELPDTQEKAKPFSDAQFTWFYHLFEKNTIQFADLPTLLIQHEFNAAFGRIFKRFFYFDPVLLERLQTVENRPEESEVIRRLHMQFKGNNAWRFDALSPELQIHVNNRFVHYRKEVLPTHAERLTTFTLENIRNLNENRINTWHAVISAKQADLWDGLPCEKKIAFNAKFAEFGKQPLPLGNIAAFPMGMNLAELRFFQTHFAQNTPIWDGLDRGVRSRFAQAFYEAQLPVVKKDNAAKLTTDDWLVLPNSPEEVTALHENQVRWLREIFRVGTSTFHGLPILVQHALNVRTLEYVNKYRYFTPLTMEGLQGIEGHDLEEAILKHMLDYQFEGEDISRFDALPHAVQQHLNGRFVHFEKNALPTHGERLGSFTLENIRSLNENRVKKWHEILSDNPVDLWTALPIEKQIAFNAKFAQHGKEKLYLHINYFPDDMNAAERKVCHNHFFSNIAQWKELNAGVRAQFIEAFYRAGNLDVVDPETDGTINADWLVLPNSREAIEALTNCQLELLACIIKETDRLNTLPVYVQFELCGMLKKVSGDNLANGITLASLQHIEGTDGEKAIMRALDIQLLTQPTLFGELNGDVQEHIKGRFAHHRLSPILNQEERAAKVAQLSGSQDFMS